MNTDKHGLENDSFPFYSGFLEVYQEAELQA